MTEQELREKIVKIIRNMDSESDTLDAITLGDIKSIADALIAEGIGDVSELKKHRLLLLDDGTGKQLYIGEEVENIVKERDEYKHRAEVAERKIKIRDIALLEMAEIIDWDRGTDDETPEEYVKYHLQQAEKELQEERKDDDV